MSYYINLNIAKNRHFKIHDDQTVISCKESKTTTCLKWTYGLLGQNYRIATFSTLIICVNIYHFEVEIDRTILTCLNKLIEKAQNCYV